METQYICEYSSGNIVVYDIVTNLLTEFNILQFEDNTEKYMAIRSALEHIGTLETYQYL